MFDSTRDRADGESQFSARWHTAPPRFAPWGNPSAAPGTSAGEEAIDGTAVGDDRWLDGFTAGKEEAQADLAREADAMDALLQALDRLAPLPDMLFAERLEQEVRSLLARLVGSASVDEDLLIARCAALAEMASNEAATVLHANPDDAALLAATHPALSIVADDRLPRGELLLVDGAGEAAAGPRTMMADWAAQAGDDPC